MLTVARLHDAFDCPQNQSPPVTLVLISGERAAIARTLLPCGLYGRGLEARRTWGAFWVRARNSPKGDGFLSVTESAPEADRYGDESDANP